MEKNKSKAQRGSDPVLKKPEVNADCISVSNRFRVAKYASALLLVFFVLLMFTLYREDITIENFRYFIRYIDTRNAQTDTADTIRYDSANVSDMCMYRGSVAIVDDTSLKVYDLKGDNTLSQSIRYANPNILAGDKYMLVYNIGGNSYALFNSLSKLYEQTGEYPTSSASINDSGMYVIVSKTQEYRSAVTLYSSEFEPLYNWYSPDKFVMATDISDNDRDFLIAAVSTDNAGTAFTEILGCRVGNEEKRFSIHLEDTIALDIRYNDDNSFMMLCDTGIYFYQADGTERAFHSFEGYIPTRAELSEDRVYFALNRNVVGSEHTVTVLDGEGEPVFSGVVNGEITDYTLTDDAVYFLMERTIIMAPFSGGEWITRECKTGGNRLMTVDNDRLMLCFSEKTEVLNINNFFYSQD